MNNWIAVVYVVGKKNAAALRRALTTTRVIIVVDARLPLIYSRRIDVAYLAANRARLLARTHDFGLTEFASPTWIHPRELPRISGDSKRSAPIPPGSRRIWILTGIDTPLGFDTANGAIETFLGRIDDALDAAPSNLRDRPSLRVGLFHDDLRMRQRGIERVALGLNRFFDGSKHGPNV